MSVAYRPMKGGAGARGHGWHQVCFGWLNLVLTAPSVYLWLGLPLIMRQHGWSGVELGLFQLAALPAAFKFLMAAPIDRQTSALPGVDILRRYRRWACMLCLLFAAVLLLIGRRPLLASPHELFVLAFGAALLATWADVPVNALAIRLLPPHQRQRAGGIRSAALSLGAIVGGGLMLLAQQRWGWRAPFWIMAASLLPGLLALMSLRLRPAPPLASSAAGPTTAVAAADWRGYFTQRGGGRWSVLLLLCFPVIGATWFYLKPLMLDHGFAPPQVAAIAGIGGGVVAAAGGMLAPLFSRRFGLARALPGAAGLCLLALLSLFGAVLTGGAPWIFVAAAGLVALAMGCTAAVAFALMMYFARSSRSAADYGVQASLFSGGRIAVPLLAGIALDRFGYGGMLGMLLAAMLLVLWLTVKARTVIGERADKYPTCS